MFSTLFSLSQLILMGRSSTITDLIVKWVCTEAYNSVPMVGFLENQSKFTSQYGITDM